MNNDYHWGTIPTTKLKMKWCVFVDIHEPARIESYEKNDNHWGIIPTTMFKIRLFQSNIKWYPL